MYKKSDKPEKEESLANCLTVTKNTCIHVKKLLIKSYFMLNITLEMVKHLVVSLAVSFLVWQSPGRI